jgi:hypothetical protein
MLRTGSLFFHAYDINSFFYMFIINYCHSYSTSDMDFWIHICEYMFMYVQACMCAGACAHGCYFSGAIHLRFCLRQGLLPPWSSVVRLNWLANDSHRSVCPWLLSIRLHRITWNYVMPNSHMDSKDLHSSSHFTNWVISSAPWQCFYCLEPSASFPVGKIGNFLFYVLWYIGKSVSSKFSMRSHLTI